MPSIGQKGLARGEEHLMDASPFSFTLICPQSGKVLFDNLNRFTLEPCMAGIQAVYSERNELTPLIRIFTCQSHIV